MLDQRDANIGGERLGSCLDYSRGLSPLVIDCLIRLIRLLGSTANQLAVSHWFYLLSPFLSLFYSSFPILNFVCLPRKPARLTKEVEDRLYC